MSIFSKKTKVTLPPNASGRDVRLLLEFYAWKTKEFLRENHAGNSLSTHEYSFPVRWDDKTYIFGTRYYWRKARADGYGGFCEKYLFYTVDGTEYRKMSEIDLKDRKLSRIGKVLRLMEKERSLVEGIKERKAEKER